MFVEGEASTTSEILVNYPALVRPAVVSPSTCSLSLYVLMDECICVQIGQEMGVIVGEKDIRSTFEGNWTNVVPGVLKYGSKIKKRSVVSILSTLKESGMSAW